MIDEKIFSKKDVFFIGVDIITNIISGMEKAGYPPGYCIQFLESITGTVNTTLSKQHNFSADEIRECAAGGLLDLHTFTAVDKEN